MLELMHFCYVDESGGFEAPNSRPDASPLMVVAGIFVPAAHIAGLTTDFLELNRRFHPGRTSRYLDDVLLEVKGSLLRRRVRSDRRRERRHALGLLTAVVELMETYGLRLVGRIWIKEATRSLDPRGTYTFSVQDLGRHFDRFLEENGSEGVVLCDSRDHGGDVRVAHSLFTQKYKASGDALPRLLEPVVFGRSNNHVGLQLSDIVASSLLFPIAARVYCSESRGGAHTDPRFDELRTLFAARLRELRYAYQDEEGRTRGGVTVSDRLGGRPSGILFDPPNMRSSGSAR